MIGAQAVLAACLQLVSGLDLATLSVADLSARRLGLFGLFLLIGLVFLALARSDARRPHVQSSWLDRFFGRPSLLALLLAAGAAGLAGALFFAAYPRTGAMFSVYLAFFWPAAAWWLLAIVQVLIAAWLWGGAGYLAALPGWGALPARLEHGLARANVPWVGIALLVAALLIGLAFLDYTVFDDEGDNLATGWLLSRGYVLHRDVFTHHFPLPYVWVAGVVRLGGASLPLARASLLALQLGLLACAMFAARFYLQGGLFAVAWSLTSHFHQGQQVLYDNFAAAFLLPAFLMVFAWLLRRAAPGRPALILLGLLLAAAVLSDPLMVYPVAVLLAGVFWSARTEGRAVRERQESPSSALPSSALPSSALPSSALPSSALPSSALPVAPAQALLEQARLGVKRLLPVALSAVALMGLFAMAFAAWGTLDDFYEQAIVFNSQVYSRYTEAGPNRVGAIVSQAAGGLEIGAPAWRQRTQPWMGLQTWQFGLSNLDDYEGWIFSNFSYRLAILTLAAGIILSGQPAGGALVYLLAAALLARAQSGFHAGAFIGLGQLSAVFLATGLVNPARILDDLAARKPWGRALAWTARLAWSLFAILAVGLFFWSLARSGHFLVEQRAALDNSREMIEKYAAWETRLANVTCGAEGVEFHYYPLRPMIHFSAGLPPATRYTYLTPWVADVAAAEVLAELSNNPRAVVYVQQDLTVWDYPVRDFLGWLIEFLEENYVQVEENLWLARELAEGCRPEP